MRSKAAPAIAALAPLLCGFVRSRVETPTGNGPCLFWSSRSPAVLVNEQGSRHLTGSAQFQAVAEGLGAWSLPACTDVAIEDEGLSPRTDVAYDADAGPRPNLVVWRPALCGALVPSNDPCVLEGSCDDAYDCLDDGEAVAVAVTSYFYRIDTGEILGAGTELDDPEFVFSTVDSPPCDPSRPASCDLDGGGDAGPACAAFGPPMPGPEVVNPSCVSWDVWNTMAHEAGHFLGFGHSPVPGATMNATTTPGDTQKRVLHADDVEAVCAVYPRGAPTETSCGGDAGEPDAGAADGGGGAPSGCGCDGAGGSAAAGILALLVGLGALRAQSRDVRRRG